MSSIADHDKLFVQRIMRYVFRARHYLVPDVCSLYEWNKFVAGPVYAAAQQTMVHLLGQGGVVAERNAVGIRLAIPRDYHCTLFPKSCVMTRPVVLVTVVRFTPGSAPSIRLVPESISVQILDGKSNHPIAKWIRAHAIMALQAYEVCSFIELMLDKCTTWPQVAKLWPLFFEEVSAWMNGTKTKVPVLPHKEVSSIKYKFDRHLNDRTDFSSSRPPKVALLHQWLHANAAKVSPMFPQADAAFAKHYELCKTDIGRIKSMQTSFAFVKGPADFDMGGLSMKGNYTDCSVEAHPRYGDVYLPDKSIELLGFSVSK
jgi:hypothetical protein